MNICNMYLFLINYNKILSPDNLSALKQKLHIKNKNVIIKNLNICYSSRVESLYSKEHLLINDLLNFIRNSNTNLTLFRKTMIKDYWNSRIIFIYHSQ